METASEDSVDQETAERIKEIDKTEEQLTDNIDREALQVDQSYKRVKQDLENANVPRRDTHAIKKRSIKKDKRIRLGEKQKEREHELRGAGDDGTYDDRVKEVEATADEMSTHMKVKEAEAAKKEQAARSALTEMSNIASKAYADVTKAEERLAGDLNGHKDRDLERDIEQKEQDIEEREQDNLGSIGVDTPDRSYAGSETSDNDEENGSTGDAKTNNGEDGTDTDNSTSAGSASGVDKDIVQRQANFGRPDKHDMSHQAASLATNDAVEADLSAIDQDAEQLEQYQKNAQKEIKAIRSTLN